MLVKQPNIIVEPVAGALGAEIHNVDLSRPLSDLHFNQIHDALLENQVLFFRDQEITPAQHKAFALRFGGLQSHPAYPTPEGHPEVTILEHDSSKPSKIGEWHTDMTFRPKPPLGSILYSKIVPERGGDTLWASMSAAYDGLSDKMQRFLSSLEAVHDFSYGFRHSLAEPGGRERLGDAVKANPPQIHPVIRTHPVSGKKGIFVNQLFTTHIVGMNELESRSLLNFLFEYSIQDQFTCRFRWSKNAIAFWDNRITQHKPVNDHGLAHRLMHRVTVDGIDRPN